MTKIKKKKFIAGVITAAMMCSAIPLTSFVVRNDTGHSYVSAAEGTLLYENDFEDGDAGKFLPRMNEGDSVKLTVISENAASGTGCLECSGREMSWQGITLPAEGLMETGVEYSVSASVKSQWYAELCLSIQYDDAAGQTHYANISKGTSGGDWIKFEDVRVSFPAGTTNCSLYFEGGNSNIYLDDFRLSEAPVVEIENDITSLKDAYADYFKFGTAVTAFELANKSAQNLIKKHFNSITPGNELKPESLLNQAACQAEGNNVNPIISIAPAKSILDFCRDNDIAVRGHVLVWHSQTPGWFFKEGFKDDGEWVSKEIMLQRMENYIKNVMEALAEEYPTVNFYAWDVVNEAWTDNGSPREGGIYDPNTGSTEKSGWTQIFGDNSFIPYAFEYARKYAPAGCKLYYNDFNEYMDGKLNAIINMANEIKAQGNIDGIGMQSHLDVRQGQDAFPSLEMYEKAMAKYCETGLDIQVTELDATVNEQNNTEEAFNAQAEYYSGILDSCVKHADNISAVVVWGTTDDKSWRASRYPLLFNGDFTAKPCYYSIVDGLEVAPTDPTQPVNPDFTPGDVNNDSKINVFDCIAMRRILMQDEPAALAPHSFAADVTGDGVCTVADLVLLNNYILGKDVTFKTYQD